MTPTDIRARIHHAIIPALGRADRAIQELTTPEPQGKHRKDAQ